MLSVEEHVVIGRPRQEVYDFFTDPDTVTLYAANVIEYELTSGSAREVGRTGKSTVRLMGVKLDFEDTVVEMKEGSRYKVEYRGRFPTTATVTFSDEGPGTRVTWLQEAKSLGGVFKFADGLVVTMYGKDVRANLDRAKTLLEG